MTVLTKQFTDAKPDKLLAGSTVTARPRDAETGDDIILVHGPSPRKSNAVSLLLVLASLLVLSMGIIVGLGLYRTYYRSYRFHGYCEIPYDSESIDDTTMLAMNEKYRDDSYMSPIKEIRKLFEKSFESPPDAPFFNEEFELDLTDDESYSKIVVPDFRDGQSGRFLHDFKQNQSGIIDSSKNRCFIMPLDRERVLAPKSFYDLLIKMNNGYYNIDTNVVRKNMRVVLPAVTDLSTISERIASECEDKKIYMLENYVSGVYKRSVEQIINSEKYGGFFGSKIMEYHFVNLDSVDAAEKLSLQQ